MNEKVMLKAQQEFSATAKLGAVKTCQAIGIQQAIGFSLFDLQNCK